MNDNFSTVKRLLPTLSGDELSQIREQLSMISTMKPVPAGTDEGLALESICEGLSSLGVEYAYPTLLQKTDGYSSFRCKVGPVMQFLRRGMKEKNEIRAALVLATQLLYQDLTSSGFPATARTIMRHFHRVPSVINRNFPGYAQSGMLSWIIKKG
jgi:hypothetical protein